jgi:hypothetical protein
LPGISVIPGKLLSRDPTHISEQVSPDEADTSSLETQIVCYRSHNSRMRLDRKRSGVLRPKVGLWRLRDKVEHVEPIQTASWPVATAQGSTLIRDTFSTYSKLQALQAVKSPTRQSMALMLYAHSFVPST